MEHSDQPIINQLSLINRPLGFMIDYYLWPRGPNFGSQILRLWARLWSSLVLFSRGKTGLLGYCFSIHNWYYEWFQYASMIFVVQAHLWWWFPTANYLPCVDTQVISWAWAGWYFGLTFSGSCRFNEWAVGRATWNLVISVWVKIRAKGSACFHIFNYILEARRP